MPLAHLADRILNLLHCPAYPRDSPCADVTPGARDEGHLTQEWRNEPPRLAVRPLGAVRPTVEPSLKGQAHDMERGSWTSAHPSRDRHLAMPLPSCMLRLQHVYSIDVIGTEVTYEEPSRPRERCFVSPTRWSARLLFATTLLNACATARPPPERSVPEATQIYVERAANAGTLLLDVVDGPTLVKRATDEPPWPTLCATPCTLTLPRGRHELSLWFIDDIAEPTVERIAVQVSAEPTVHRRALTRYKVERRSLHYTARALGIVGLSGFLVGLGGVPWANGRDERIAYGALAGAGALLVGVGAVFRARAGRRLRGSVVVFPLAPVPTHGAP